MQSSSNVHSLILRVIHATHGIGSSSPSSYKIRRVLCPLQSLFTGRDKDKKKGKKTEGDEGSGGDSPGSPGEEGSAEAGKEEEVVWMTDTSAQAAEERAKEQLTSAMAGMVTQVCLIGEQGLCPEVF